MNPNDVLGNLANGLSVCNTVRPLSADVLAALAATVTSQPAVTRIGTPVVSNPIDLGTLGSENQNQTEFTFTNDTAQTITYWLTTLFNRAGQPADYGILDSAVDFPAAHGSGSIGNPQSIENGGAGLRVFNNFVESLRSVIIGRIEIETGVTGSQSRQNLITRTDNITDNTCNSNKLVPFCSTCDNNNTTTFVATFRCPQGLGMGYSLGYKVLAGQEVTFRVTTIGVPVDDYVSLGFGDCGC